MSDFGQPPGGGGFGPPPGGGGGFGQPPGQPPAGGGGFGQPPAGGGGFGQPPGQPPAGGGFGAPQGGPGGEQKTETLAIVSAIAGVLGLSSCCCVCIVPVPLVAIVTGILGMKKIGQDPGLKGKELAYVGIGLGGLTILLSIASVIFNLITSGSATYDYGNMNF